MSKALNNLMDGYNPHKQLLDQTRKLTEKWQPTGLLEGLESENEVHGMSVLLENQARQLIDEASKDGHHAYRGYGRSKKGTKSYVKLPFSRGARVSIFAALNVNGFMSWEMTRGTFTRKKIHKVFSN